MTDPADPAGAAGAVADPAGVTVALIAGIEPGLGRDAICAVVAAVAGGRAKRRRLAQALAGRPGFCPMAGRPRPG